MASSSSTNSDLKLVPETILKKRHNLDELKAKRAANELQKGNRRVFSSSSSSKKLYVKKPETFLAQAKTRKHLDIRYKRVSKKGMQKRASNKKQMSTKVVEHDKEETTLLTYQSNSVGANMVFCIRIHDNVGMSGRIKKVLYKLRLKQQYTGVFVQYTDENRKLLQLVEPWVLYGTPSKSMVEDLIRKRGYTRSAVDGKRMALSDNTIIEQALGTKTGIICVEDLVEELYQTGDYFTKANSFLWPFSLRAPKSRFEITKLNEKQGKEYGDKGQEIDEYIKTML